MTSDLALPAISATGTTVLGPPVAVIAWIPFYRHLDSVPNNAFSSNHRHGALQRLFMTGNAPNPPQHLLGQEAELKAIADSRNFRAIVALTRVTTTWYKDRAPVASYSDFQVVGYTPFRLGKVAYHSPGVGSYETWVETSEAAVTIYQVQRFKLGRPANLAQWVMTRRFAPSAWLEVRYTIFRDGRVELSLRGSEIPSRNHYVAWHRVSGHDMTQIAGGDIDGFIEAGLCADAPSSSYSRETLV